MQRVCVRDMVERRATCQVVESNASIDWVTVTALQCTLYYHARCETGYLMPSSPARLNIPTQADVEWAREFANPNGTGKYQICSDGRPTESEATRRIAYGDPIGATYAALYQNGQLVDDKHTLMCSKCNQWKPDSAFAKDRRLEGITRRGRAYYCKECKAKHYG